MREQTIGTQKLPSPPNRTNRPTEEETETDETLLSTFVRRGNHCGATDVDVVPASELFVHHFVNVWIHAAIVQLISVVSTLLFPSSPSTFLFPSFPEHPLPTAAYARHLSRLLFAIHRRDLPASVSQSFSQPTAASQSTNHQRTNNNQAVNRPVSHQTVSQSTSQLRLASTQISHSVNQSQSIQPTSPANPVHQPMVSQPMDSHPTSKFANQVRKTTRKPASPPSSRPANQTFSRASQPIIQLPGRQPASEPTASEPIIHSATISQSTSQLISNPATSTSQPSPVSQPEANLPASQPATQPTSHSKSSSQSTNINLSIYNRIYNNNQKPFLNTED